MPDTTDRPRTWPEDAYHPHHPAADGDYLHRLYDRADLMGNPFRLACRIYSPAEDAAVAEFWRSRRPPVHVPR